MYITVISSRDFVCEIGGREGRDLENMEDIGMREF